jgi:DNA-binding MarR family transcriptional regulator
MASKRSKTVQPKPAQSKPLEPGSELADLAQLLVCVNRIGNRLQDAADQKNANLTISGWLLLRTLQTEGPLPMARAAIRIGMTRQRVHQQAKPLEAAGLVSITQGDSNTRRLALEPAGEALVKSLDEAFLKALAGSGDAPPALPLHAARMGAGRVLKAMTPPQPAAKAA